VGRPAAISPHRDPVVAAAATEYERQAMSRHGDFGRGRRARPPRAPALKVRPATPGAVEIAKCYPCTVADRTSDRDQTGGAVKERVQDQTREPSLYGVVLLNDDYTPMQFVVDILESLFQKSPAEAFRIMMTVHREGRGLAGVYPWEVAETKVDSVVSAAREQGYPLQATIEDA
jgi:ATP-dependent Clp protease adaptor protein ClpS